MTGATAAMREWTASEDDILRLRYPRAAWVELLAALPGRTKRAIWNHAHRLGLDREQREFDEATRARLAELARQNKPRLGKVVYPVIEREGVRGKFCCECGEWRPLEKFSGRSDCSGGVANCCTTCAGRLAYARNPERCKATVRRYHKDHPDKRRLHKQAADKKRHGRIMEGPGVSTGELRELLHLFGGMCAYCRVADADTFDHVNPLSRGGKHEIANLLPACKSCNFEKHDKTLEEWTAHKAARRP